MNFSPCFKFYCSKPLSFEIQLFVKKFITWKWDHKTEKSITHNLLNGLQCNFEVPNLFVGRKVSFSKMQTNVVNSCKNWMWQLTFSHLIQQRKLWSSGRALGSRSEGRGFNPCPMLDVSGVRAMPGLISTPNSSSLQKNKKIQVVKWDTPKKIFEKKNSHLILARSNYRTRIQG